MLEYLSANRVVRLHNITCPYCGIYFSEACRPDKEHVIGRRFVPKGALANQWNLIVNSCRKCNHEKSQLEDDIAVISLMSGRAHTEEATAAVVAGEIARRAEKSGSRATGRSVATSHETFQLALSPSKGMKISFGFNAPPQISDQRALRLAELHFRAFFYFVSYRNSERRGGGPGPIRFVGRYVHSDWGNPEAKWFMELQQGWDIRFCGHLASGFFKISVRQAPIPKLWALAVEWNHSIRIMALAGHTESLDEVGSTMPEPHGHWMKDADGHTIRMTQHLPLAECEDTLFNFPTPDQPA